MNEAARVHLRKAHERLEDAEVLFSRGRNSGTVNRTYYAMFEAASGLLADAGLVFNSHQGVITKFGELFVKSGKVAPDFGRDLSRGFHLREDADYALGARAEITGDVAESELAKARRFVAMAEAYLRSGE